MLTPIPTLTAPASFALANAYERIIAMKRRLTDNEDIQTLLGIIIGAIIGLALIIATH